MSESVDPTRVLDETDAPTDVETEVLDVRAAGPPTPLRETLEHLANLPEGTVLVQRNDRAPQHLYPRLEERGYEFETVERDEEIVTVVWNPSA